MGITNWSIRHSVTIFVFMVILAVTGWKSYQSLPRESQPDVTIPYVMVSVPYVGVAPEDIETLIIDELEEEFERLKDVEEIRSTAADGMGMITIEFKAGVDMDTALSDVRERVDLAKPELPDDAEDPVITEISFSDFPIMNITLNGDVDLVELKRVAKLLEDDINRVKGILDARIIGGLEREIRVEADPDLLAYYNVSFDELINVVDSENQNIPGGSIDVGDQTYLVRVPGEFEEVSEIEGLIVREEDGRAVYVRDVAEVIDGFEDVTSHSRIFMEEAVSVIVTRRAGENIIRITDELRGLVSEYEDLYGESITFTVLDDVSDEIRDTLNELENNILTGLLLVLMILMVFLGKIRTGLIKLGVVAGVVALTILFTRLTGIHINPWGPLVLTLGVMLFFDKGGSLRTSLFVAAAIPFSMLISFIVLSIMGITLNIVVLFSLILALGMLVDNAIVIVENVFRHMTMGKPRMQAAMDAVAEVAWPVVGATATTVGAFIPLLFWPGIMGEFMFYLPMTVLVVLLSSLFVALVINPVLCANFMIVDPDLIGTTVDDGLDETRDIPTTGIYRIYRATLEFATQTKFGPIITVLGSVVALIASIALFVTFNASMEFFPSTTPERIKVNVVLPDGSNIDASDVTVRRVEEWILDREGVKHLTAGVGAGTGQDALSGAGAATAHESRVSIEFEEDFVTADNVQEFILDLRAYLETVPGARFEVERDELGPPTGDPINLELQGRDYTTLQNLSVEAMNIIRGVDGIVDLKSDFETGRQELAVRVDRRQAGLLGVSTLGLASTIRAAVNGTEASVFRQDDDEYDIVVRMKESRRQNIEDVGELYVKTPTGERVQISEIADFNIQDSLGAIQHVDSSRVITVSADVKEGYNENAVLRDAQKAIDANLSLPPSYQTAWTGQNKEQEDAQEFLSAAMLAALSIVVLVLITQFNSLLQTGMIMFSVLLALIGVFLMLVVRQMPFVMIMTGVGVISLAGIVVNNGIILIDYMNQLRERGLDLEDAVLTGGLVRFRPVMLTALTTILSLIPTVIGVSLNAKTFRLEFGGSSVELWGPMANAVTSGLIVSTILVLVVIPAMYVLAERTRMWFSENLVGRFGGGQDLAAAGATSGGTQPMQAGGLSSEDAGQNAPPPSTHTQPIKPGETYEDDGSESSEGGEGDTP